MSVYANNYTILGVKLTKEELQQEGVHDILSEIESDKDGDLDVISLDPMSDSDQVIGKVLYHFTDDGYPNEEDMSSEFNINDLSTEGSKIVMYLFIRGFYDKLNSKINFSSKEVKLHTFTSYG